MQFLPLQAGFVGGIEVLIALVWLVVSLAISYHIYKDAKDSSSNYATVWGLAAVFGSVVVWVLYFIVRDEVG